MADRLLPSYEDFGLAPDWVVAAPASGQLLYRITVDEVPVLLDFFTQSQKRDPRRQGESALLYVGLSMFADRGQAEAVRDRFKKGQHVAEVPLRPGHGFALARTRRTPGHHTVWGVAEDLLAVTLDHAR